MKENKCTNYICLGGIDICILYLRMHVIFSFMFLREQEGILPLKNEFIWHLLLRPNSNENSTSLSASHPTVFSAQTSLKGSSPNIQLAARNCFILEDPPDDNRRNKLVLRGM
ncbi:hypothetical protein V6Z12_D02G231900 [Gossypium hirsutum]